MIIISRTEILFTYIYCCFPFLQYMRNDWCDLATVCIEELSGIEYGALKESTVKAIGELLGPAIAKAVSILELTPEDERLVTPFMTLFNSPSMVCKYIFDLRLYMEACIASEKSGRSIEFLVTDDHSFFKAFIQSSIAERVLQKEVKAVLDLKKTVRVKLAGEVIKGM